MPELRLRTDDFDYTLPPELIADRPLVRRDASRLMLIDRQTGKISHHEFSYFPTFLRPSDLVVLNDTRVVKARFFSDEGKIELLRLSQELVGEQTAWRCLVKPGKKMRLGAEITVGGCVGTVTQIHDEDGARTIVWTAEAPDDDRHGQLALPHYFGREQDTMDDERYQTVYAQREKAGAIAAPTAGLHFTPEILAQVTHTSVTLHVGLGTFRPVQAEWIDEHVMHTERYEISAPTAEKIQAASRVCAVGTTVTRVLEHVHRTHGAIVPGAGETSIFLHPGVSFGAVGALLTNFHLPKSTLLMLVSAFAGTELMRAAYAEAIRERYRFYSYGDCMLII
jgi:S-adenosylmethionine:tRNA ribosyltransferase-isomerase